VALGVPDGSVGGVSDGAIVLDRLSVDFDGGFALRDIDWRLEPDRHWLVLGPNGAGKSALAAVLAGAGEKIGGHLAGVPERVALVSYELQAELIAAELRKDDADILDVISEGTPVRELAYRADADAARVDELVEAFGLVPLLERSFRKLSTGETRKLMLVRALSSAPQLLILDEPFDGLDADTHARLQAYLTTLADSLRLVIVLNRLDEAPAFVTDVAYVDGGRLVSCVSCADKVGWAELRQLLHLKCTDLNIPKANPAAERLPALDPDQPLVRLQGATIRYGDTVIFEGIDWTIRAGEHWQLSGPNGSGKTGLLSLITGDHPQCYTNDITVFGYRRGSGESIWEIKRYLGYVSTALQWEYRVSASVRHVIISGFHDSIGLYTKYSDDQARIADAWLDLLGMGRRAHEPFTQLSHGDQRLLLIARAMVKHPPLLILDEPCLGLDDMNRQLVLTLIERICAGSETTVLYVNHHAGDVVPGIARRLTLGQPLPPLDATEVEK